MGMLKMIKAGWKAQTPVEKIKTVVKLVCSMGMGTICADVAHIHTLGKTKLEKVSVLVASYGMGCYLGDKSGDAIGEVIDAAVQLNEIRKNLKEDEKNA